jgi:hypothetical protein
VGVGDGGAKVTVPIFWVTYGENSINRGYWDDGILEALFSRELWRPVGAADFVHYESFDALPDYAGGAIVVVPARHNVKHVDRLNADLKQLEWVLLILTGDEESVFPLDQVDHPSLRVWWMSGRPDRQRGTAHKILGSGWPPQAREHLPRYRDEAAARDLDWFFSGQITHSRRTNCAKALERLVEPGKLVRTPSFTAGLPHDEYYRLMASAKVVPCPSGAVSLDSFRVYEALEAGCLPVVDNMTPSGRQRGYWNTVLSGVTMPSVDDWDRLPLLMAGFRETWQALANKTFSAWQAWRRQLAYDLEAELVTLGEVERSPAPGVADLITVIVVTSPIPSHPSTAVIDETLASIDKQEALAWCEKLVLVEGVRQEQHERVGDYETFTQQLLWDCLHERRQTLPVVFQEHMHQAKMLRHALELVRTPLVLFVEHDTPIHGDIAWAGIAEAILREDVNLVRLHHESSILPPHEHLMVDREPRMSSSHLLPVPLMRTAQWSQRPHVASASFYRRVLTDHFRKNARTMIEDVMHSPVAHAWFDDGLEGWERYKLAIYAPPGDMKRSWHTDGRAGDDKFEMFLGDEGEE